MKKKVLVKYVMCLVVVIMLSFVLSVCAEAQQTSNKKVSRVAEQFGGIVEKYNPSLFDDLKAKKNYKIACLHYGLQNEAPVLLADAQKARAKELSVTVDMFDANYDVNTEMAKMENIIVSGYDLILFSAVDSEASVACADKAIKAGIPIINVHSYLKCKDLVSTIVSDSIQAGEDEMEWVAKSLGGKGNIVIMEGPIGCSGEVLRSQGIDNILMDYPNIDVLARKTANWSRAEGLALMENWFMAFPDKINAVVSQNDEMALGAIQAATSKGIKDGDLVVIGVDGISDALAAIKKGKMQATLFQDTTGQGKLSIELAVAYLNGDKIGKYYWIPYELVTKDNVDEYISRVEKQ